MHRTGIALRPPRSAKLALAALACAALLIGAAGCSRDTPEQRLRETVHGLQAAMAGRDAGAIGDYLAQDFIGNDGLDRDTARRLAALHFMRNRNVGVTLGPLEVVIHDDRARVDCTAALTGGSGQWLPESGRIYSVRSGWRLESGQWRLTSLEWTSPGRNPTGHGDEGRAALF